MENLRTVLVSVRYLEHEYVIYTSGEIQGFEPGGMVTNLFPELRDHAIHVDRLQRDSAKGIPAKLCATETSTSSMDGGAHSTPE